MIQKKAREPKYSSAVHRSPSLRKLLLVSQLRKREVRDRSLLQEHVVRRNTNRHGHSEGYKGKKTRSKKEGPEVEIAHT